MLTIKPESNADAPTVREVLVRAFGTSLEADLVDALRAQARPLVSLVAVRDDAIVGHVMCSPVTLPPLPNRLVMGLAPVAVMPEGQRQGIGSALVEASVQACRDLGAAAMVVLGHPGYYPRFGFVPASRFGVRCEYDVPEDVFMAMELEPDALAGQSGTVRYHPAFPRE